MIELQLRRHRRGALLMRPYDHLLTALAVREGLAAWRFKKPAEDSLIDPDLATATLQFLLLDDDVSILYVPPSVGTRDGQFKGLHVEFTGLTSLGVVTLIEPDAKTVTRLRALEGREAIWEAIAPTVRESEDFILGQLDAAGIHLHWAVLRLLLAVRTGNDLLVKLVLPSVPPEWRQVSNAILSGEWTQEVIESLDRPVFDAAVGIEVAYQVMNQRALRAIGAGARHRREGDSHDTVESSSQLWKLVLGELLAVDLELPVPNKITEVLKIRALPEMRALREFLYPFLDAIAEGDASVAGRLRKEVRSAMRAMKTLPLVRRTISCFAYASLGVGVVEGLSGVFGPSILTGLVPIGLQRLARRWEAQAGWVYLAEKRP